VTFEDVLAWFAAHAGRRIRVVVYSDDLPLATLEARLGPGAAESLAFTLVEAIKFMDIPGETPARPGTPAIRPG
jgi:hypothetical protein